MSKVVPEDGVTPAAQSNGNSGNTQNYMPKDPEAQKTVTPPDFQKEKARNNDDQVAGCFIATGILHPYSTPRLAWDMWIVLLLVYTALMVPFALAFQAAVCGADADIGQLVVLWFVDCCFWFDIILNFRTAILDPNADNLTQMQLVSDWKIIAKTYLKGWFWLDAVGSVPVQAIEQALSEGNCSLSALKTLRLNRLARLARLVKLLRLARLARWNRLITKAKDALSINPGHLRLLQFVIFVFVLAHLLACILYGMVEFQDGYSINWASEVEIVVPGSGLYVLACPSIVTDEKGDVAADSSTRFIEENGVMTVRRECLQSDGMWRREAPPEVKYLISLYVTFTTLTTVGYGDITMRTTPELIFGIVMMALGASTFAVVVGNMAALLGKLDIRATAFKERMEDLDDFMHQENLPLDLRFRTRAFFEYGYNHSRDIPSSIEELSMSLRTEVALHLYNDLITTVPFFRDCGKEFLTEVILRLKAQTLSPGDYLYEAGEYGDSMYFLIKGSVEVVLDDKNGVFAELREGSYFGENCVLGLADHRPVSVRAMTWCNLFCLTQDALEDCIAHHPEAHEHFRRLAYQQTAEKTVSSAVKRLSEIRSGGDQSNVATRLPSDDQLKLAMGDTPAVDGENGGEELVEPPVVTRALQRTKRGQASLDRVWRKEHSNQLDKDYGASYFTRQTSGGVETEAKIGPDSGLGAEIIASITAVSAGPAPSPGNQAAHLLTAAIPSVETNSQPRTASLSDSACLPSQAQEKSRQRRTQLKTDLEKLHDQLKDILTTVKPQANGHSNHGDASGDT